MTNAERKISEENLVYFLPAKRPNAPMKAMHISPGICMKNFVMTSQTG